MNGLWITSDRRFGKIEEQVTELVEFVRGKVTLFFCSWGAHRSAATLLVLLVCAKHDPDVAARTLEVWMGVAGLLAT